MLQVLDFTQDNVLATRAVGTVTEEDYEKIKPVIRNITERGEKIRWYYELQNDEAWEPGAVWEDLKVDLKHTSDYEKVAVVGEKKWQEAITKAYSPFTKAEVQYFSLADKEQAQEWITH